jgi:hypothetical protein
LADCLRDTEDIQNGLIRFERAQLPFGRDMVALSRQQGAYLSAQVKPLAQRQSGELRRDVEALLHAHGTRSDQISEIVAARGLDVYLSATR